MTDVSGRMADRLSRRELLGRGAALGLFGATLSALVAACGESSKPAPTAPAANAPVAAPTVARQVAPPATVVASPSPAAAGQANRRSGGELKVGWGGFQTFDPHVTSSLRDYLFINAVYDKLVERTTDGKLYPGLATEWTTSPDGLTWTFKLRQGVKFHDGTPFDAEAVKFNFDRIVNPATKSQYAVFILGPYESSRVIDASTVELKLKSKYGRLLSALASGGLAMVSPAAAKQYGEDYAQHPVGTGPFKFQEWVQNDHVTLVRNPDYQWASGRDTHQGPAYLDQVRIQIIPEAGTLTAGLLSGQIDAGGIATADWAKLQSSGFTTKKYLVEGYPPAGHFINVTKPPTDDLRVRQAIIFALDFDAINEAVFDGTSAPANDVISTFSWAYDPEAGKLYHFDRARANSLLDEAGWVKNGEYRTKAGQELSLVYVTFTTLKNLAEAVQAQLKEVGFKVEVIAEDYPPYQEDTQKGKHNIAWTQWSGLDPGDLHKIFGSENIGVGWNLSHYKNADVDQWLTEGDAENDQAKRKEIYAKVQRQLMQDAVYAPLYNYTLLWAFKKGLTGVEVADMVGSAPVLYELAWSE